jgi:polyisoprenoid-binding protein YceI
MISHAMQKKCQEEKILGDIFSDGAVLKAVSLTIPVKNIVNEDEDLTENMHEAFKLEDHPNIYYTLTSATIEKVNSNTVKAKTKGKLKISGVTKYLSFNIIIKRSGDNLKVSGNTKVKMTDFDIEPPSMFLGTVTTDDVVKIFFDLTLTKA